MPPRPDTDLRRRIPLGQRLARYGVNLLRAPFVVAVLWRRFGAGMRLTTIHRVAVMPELGIAFNRVKKNANTTLTILLRELAGGGAAHRDIAKWEALTPFDLPLSRLAVLNQSHWIVVIRNPYSRLLSAFLDKFRESGYQRRHGAFALTPAGFADFVTWLEQGGRRRDAHWDLPINLILGPLDRFDSVLRFETLGADLKAALAASHVSFDAAQMRAAYPSDESKRTGASDRIAQFYTPELAARVASLYASDFATLGYDPALAPGTPQARPAGA